MAISLVGSPTTAVANASSGVTINMPVGLAAGDVVYVLHRSTLPGSSYAGWVEVGTGNSSQICFRLVVSGTPPTSLALTSSAGAQNGALCFAFRGVDNTTPEDVAVTQATATSTDPNPAAATPTTTGAWALVLVGTNSVDAAVTVPSGYGNHATTTTSTTTVAGATKSGLTASVAEDPPSWTNWISSGWRTYTIILRPAADVAPFIGPPSNSLGNVSFPQSLRTWTQSPFIGNIPPYVPPFRQNDWPNPKGAASSIRIHVDMAKLPLYAAGTVKPFNQADWPLPNVAPYAVQLRTWIQQPYIGDIPVPTGQAPFRNTDWPNPKAAARPIDSRGQQSLILTTLASPIGKSTPSIQFRPLPKIDGPLTQSLALATFAATPVRPVLWPQPITALYPQNLRTWTQNLLETTLAPSGLPFAFMAWKLPRQAPRFTPATLDAYNLPLNTPAAVADCGHLYPSFSTSGHIGKGVPAFASLRPSAAAMAKISGAVPQSASLKPAPAGGGQLDPGVRCS